jgi:hypothetical protein
VASKGKGRPPKAPKEHPPKAPKEQKPIADEAEGDKAAARRVALMRNKLTDAMEDPLMRSQIVAAIRTMMKNNG